MIFNAGWTKLVTFGERVERVMIKLIAHSGLAIFGIPGPQIVPKLRYANVFQRDMAKFRKTEVAKRHSHHDYPKANIHTGAA